MSFNYHKQAYRKSALEIEMDGTCWELDEIGEPPAIQFARLLKRHDPDVILSNLAYRKNAPSDLSRHFLGTVSSSVAGAVDNPPLILESASQSLFAFRSVHW